MLDACVLYPAAQRDLFMWLAAGGAVHAHWTNEIHDEWMRNVERDFKVARPILERVRQLMNQAAGDALIHHYRKHERLFPNTDAKDRHVAAAAVTARLRSRVNTVTIVTWNIKDFDHQELAMAGLVAENPDTFYAACSPTRRKTLSPHSVECATICATRQKPRASAPTRLRHKV